MKSFVRSNFPLTCVLARRQFNRLAKDMCKVSVVSEPVSKEEKSAEKVTFHRDEPSYTQKVRNDTKVSAAVRASLLSKDDTKSTVLEPAELRDPVEIVAAVPLAPKRSELDQRKARKTQCANQLQALNVQKKNTSSSALTVQCVPFVRMTQGSGERSCDTVEDLLSRNRDPMWLAKAYIKLKRDLQAEREKIMAITESYLELRAELYAKNMEIKALREGKPSSSSSSIVSVKPLVIKIK